ncbi:MAG: helix-turn-helix transcriptional regulator [Gammaproteobacteria bacterium]|nr:helix-turn-helix transcriptional regulator [Gammaproteobacteria bacterium]
MKTELSDPVAGVEQRFALAAATLIEATGQNNFFPKLICFLQNRVGCDSIVVLAYHPHYVPLVLHEDLDRLDKEALYAHYFEGAYLLSPFYLRWLAATQVSALYRLQNIAPEGFFDSLYYTDYYGRTGLCDEMGYIVPLQNESAVLISLGRTAQFQVYSKHEQQSLHAVEPFISRLVQLHLSMLSKLPDSAQSSTTPLKKQMADTLEVFGSTLLTEKEKKVVQLMLRGHSSKSCARELGISPTTERVHRRNIYAKLQISSQAELFTLFFDALAA